MFKSVWKAAKRYLPAILWMMLIFYLSSQSILPGPQLMAPDFIFKKLAHIFFYAVLYFWLFYASNGSLRGKKWVLPFILGLIFAASDEYHQSFTPGRTARIRDIGYDAIGMSIAYLRMKGYI